MSVISDYEIVRSLGMGATSEVFWARRPNSGQNVALKVFSPLVLTDPEATQRLEAEVEILSSLQHPNIVSLYRTLRTEKEFSLELELVEGTDLRKWAQDNPVSLLEPRFWILSQIARGLGGAHERGILHRDLKPENILVSNSGQVKITDFGLARSITRMTLTRMGLLVGSLGYMAPEVVNGRKASEKSDIFSFGVLAYELLAGRSPFHAETPQALIHNMSSGIWQPLRECAPFVPLEIAECVDACLAKEPDKRPESIWSVEAALMNTLVRSQFLHLAPLLASRDQRETVLAMAYQKKHKALTEQIESLKMQYSESPSPALRRQILVLINESRHLFPDDTKVLSILQELTTPEKPQPRRSTRKLVLLLAFFSTGLSLSLWFWFQGFPQIPSYLSKSVEAKLPASVPVNVPVKSSVHSPEALPNNVQPVLPTTLPEKIAEPRVPEKSEPTAKKTAATTRASVPSVLPSKKTGHLKFEVDDDVEVFVDEVKVPISAYHHYEVSTGLHKIRLAKRGYVPIQSQVDIQANKESLIRVKGDVP